MSMIDGVGSEAEKCGSPPGPEDGCTLEAARALLSQDPEVVWDDQAGEPYLLRPREKLKARWPRREPEGLIAALAAERLVEVRQVPTGRGKVVRLYLLGESGAVAEESSLRFVEAPVPAGIAATDATIDPVRSHAWRERGFCAVAFVPSELRVWDHVRHRATVQRRGGWKSASEALHPSTLFHRLLGGSWGRTLETLNRFVVAGLLERYPGNLYRLAWNPLDLELVEIPDRPIVVAPPTLFRHVAEARALVRSLGDARTRLVPSGPFVDAVARTTRWSSARVRRLFIDPPEARPSSCPLVLPYGDDALLPFAEGLGLCDVLLAPQGKPKLMRLTAVDPDYTPYCRHVRYGHAIAAREA